jgi:hypothetical protein
MATTADHAEMPELRKVLGLETEETKSMPQEMPVQPVEVSV